MKKQFLTLCVFTLILSCSTFVKASKVNLDSLLHVAQTSIDLNQKANTYRNLADVYLDKPEEYKYLNLLYNCAKKIKNTELTLSALCDLSYSFIKKGKIDSVYHYMSLIKKETTEQNENLYLSHIRMKLYDYRTSKGTTEAEAAINYEQDCLNKANKNDIYIKIEQAYIIGTSLYDNKKFEEANLNLKNAYELASTLSGKEDIKYRANIGWLYANSFRNEAIKKRIVVLKEVLNIYRNDYEKNYEKQRPFYQVNRFYLQCYSSLLMRIDLLSKEELNYYIQQIKKISVNVDDPFDKYYCFLAMSNFYLYTEDYKNALKINDSLCSITKVISPLTMAGNIRMKSEIYEQIGDYKNALEAHKRYTFVKDSLSSQELQEQLNKLQVEYEIDKLKFEKADLENKNKQVLLITLSIILLLVVVACIYLYQDLKKEKKRKVQLYKLNLKAEESEKQKTMFINSMCHEIRTPLNAIVGFSDIVTDESIDNESKREFCDLITANTQILTSLIEHLLMVANLDSSDETLPQELTDIKSICQEEFDKAVRLGKKSIQFQIDMPGEDVVISTNEKYLSLVVGNLLNNANKFTQAGTVTLTLSIDKSNNGVRIEVSDTGCGIPTNKHEVIFQRFTKLDTFTQGNGLGLFLSKLIINRLEGNIYVDPLYNSGARFVIYLPRK